MRRSDSKLEGLHYNLLMEWLESNKTDLMEPEMVEYLEQLDKVRGWYYSLHTEAMVIKALMTAYPKLTFSAAKTRFTDSLNYFYSDSEIKKEAWRNIYANDIDRCYKAIIESAKDPMHYLAAIKGIEKASNARKLDEDDDDKIPLHLLTPQTPIIVMDVRKIGGTEVDRAVLADQIKNYKVTEQEKRNLNRDAGNLPYEVIPKETNE